MNSYHREASENLVPLIYSMMLLILCMWEKSMDGQCWYYALQVSYLVESSGSQVLNSGIQVTEAVSLYNDRDRCHSLTFPRQVTYKPQ